MPSPTQPVTLTEADILDALRDCYDPEVQLNIVDLGLVYSIRLAPDPDAPGAGIPGVPPRHRVHVDLVVSQIADRDDTRLAAIIQNRLAAFETISRTEVKYLAEPAWNPGRISPEGRQRLAATTSNQRKPANGLIQIKT
jgi:metal-sulfur cluster biosynthetic enzyme